MKKKAPPLQKRRMCGGPLVAVKVAEWWDDMMQKVAQADGMAACSAPDLLTRIAVADLDLTYPSIEMYKQCKCKKTLRNGAGSH